MPSELWDPDEDEAEAMEGFEEAHAVEATMSWARKAATGNTPTTPPPKKTRTAALVAVEQGGAQSSQVQRLSSRAMLNPRDTELFALSQRACAIIPALASSNDFASRLYAWFCSCAHPGRHWPACFELTCGCPWEGPLTTPDTPDAPGMCLAPTLGIMACGMVRRKTKEKRGRRMVCRACGTPLPTQKEWSQVQEMPCVGLLGGV